MLPSVLRALPAQVDPAGELEAAKHVLVANQGLHILDNF